MDRTDLPWIEPTTSDLAAPWIVPVRVHAGKDTFQDSASVWHRPKTLRRENQ